MEILVSFYYRQNKYIIFQVNETVFLGKVDLNGLVLMSKEEKDNLKDIITLFITKKISRLDLDQYQITILDKNIEPSTYNQNLIRLSLNNEQKHLLFSNCSSFYKHKVNMKKILLISLISLICIFLFILIFNKSKISLYMQYKRLRISDYSIKMSIEKINLKSTNKLFHDEYIDMEIPFNNYELIKTENNDNQVMNLYSVDDNTYLAIIAFKTINQDKLNQVNEVIKSNYPTMDLNQLYQKHHINDMYDLIHKVIYYSTIKIDYKSSTQELNEGIFFESLLPLLFNKNMKGIVFFTNNRYGYAYINDQHINISLKTNNQEYSVVINSSKKLNINHKQLIQMISTLNYNE